MQAFHEGAMLAFYYGGILPISMMFYDDSAASHLYVIAAQLVALLDYV